jgi:hypothetical protein
MLNRPRDLADWFSDWHKPEMFTLPVEAARLKAREILNSPPQDGGTIIVEQWRQTPDGMIEFAARRLPATD